MATISVLQLECVHNKSKIKAGKTQHDRKKAVGAVATVFFHSFPHDSECFISFLP